MTILAGIAALIAGTVLAFGVRGANTERLMAPEEFADETWGITLFTVNWANGALAAGLGAAIGGVATGGTASAALAGIALGSYTWAGRLLLRQAVAERELAARELGIAETATTEEKTAHTVDRRMRRHELWRRNATLDGAWHVNAKLTSTITLSGNMGGACTTIVWLLRSGEHGGGLERAVAVAASIGVAWYCEQVVRTEKQKFPVHRRVIDEEQKRLDRARAADEARARQRGRKGVARTARRGVTGRRRRWRGRPASGSAREPRGRTDCRPPRRRSRTN